MLLVCGWNIFVLTNGTMRNKCLVKKLPSVEFTLFKIPNDFI